jgi:hypothetical protein
MPSKDTDVLTIRADRALCESVRSTAQARGMSVNKWLVLQIEALFARAPEVQISSKDGRDLEYHLEQD